MPRGVALAVVPPSLIAWWLSPESPAQLSTQLAIAYTALMSGFAVEAASIATTSAVYLGGLCALYLVLGRQKWWAYLWLDVVCGAVSLFLVDVVWCARNLKVFRTSDDYTPIAGWNWLPVVIDAALCILAAGVVGVAIYVAHKLRKMETGNVGGLADASKVVR